LTPRESSIFAVFDIDGTLIRWQLFHATVHHLGKHGFIPADAHERIKQARMNWKVRTTDEGFEKYELALVLEYLEAIKRITPQQCELIYQEVFDEYKDQTFTYTRDLIKDLKEKGYTLIAISGSQDQIIQKLAKHHGFDIAVGATMEQIDGKYSGKITTPIFDKAKALQQIIDEHGLTTKDSYGVGDSKSDVPMLEMVDNPIVFNPDTKFFKIAKSKQWKIVVERKNMTYELEPHDGTYLLA
jgi:HAD superfamily hydrolase (TIGR01490 family)